MKYKLLIPILLLGLSGCTTLHKHYGYESEKQTFLDGTLRVSLHGKWNNQTNEENNPYQLDFCFEAPEQDLPDKDITFRIDRIIYKSGSIIDIKKTISEKTRYWKAWSPERAAVFAHLYSLHLNYEPVTIQGSITYKGETENFNITLKTKYESEIHVPVFDNIMSVKTTPNQRVHPYRVRLQRPV